MKLVIIFSTLGLVASSLIAGSWPSNKASVEKPEMNTPENNAVEAENRNEDDFEFAGMTMTEAEATGTHDYRYVRWSFVNESARNKSYERLVESISEAGDVWNVLMGLSHVPSADPPLDLKMVVGDSRVGELYGMLSQLPQSEAQTKCKALFDMKFHVFKSQCESNKLDETGSASQYNKYALLVSLFLSSQLCDSVKFDEMMCEWMCWHANQIQAGGVGDGFRRHAGPQAVETLNLYILAMHRKGTTIDEIRQWINQMLCPMFSQEPPHPGTICMAKLHNSKVVLLECPIFIAWSRPVKFLRLDRFGIKHHRVVQMCRHRLNPPGLLEQSVAQGTDLIIQGFQDYRKDWDDYLRNVVGIPNPNQP
jgi:hypothetical protein